MWSKYGYKFRDHLEMIMPEVVETVEREWEVWQNSKVECTDCKKIITIKRARDQYGYWQCYECYKFDKNLDENYK